MFEDAEIISVYTRSQAIEDGVLVDVTETAKEAGFKHPTAITIRAWHETVAVDEDAAECGDSESGRLWDVLWMLRNAILRSNNSADVIKYQLYVRRSIEREELVTLKAVCGPGDNMEPVITIMLPGED